jgi:hypothetical protein
MQQSFHSQNINIFFVKLDALLDLNKAINLSTDKFLRTKCLAYTQRGIIKRKMNDMEGARSDFNESAKLGSEFSREQLVELNPYTQLCNQMVSKMLSEQSLYNK